MAQNDVPVNVLSLMGTGKYHTGPIMWNRRDVSASFDEELFYELESIYWCVVMQKISVIALAELRPLTMDGFHQTTSSRSVQRQQFVQVFGENLYQHIQTPTQHFPRSVKTKAVQRAHCIRRILSPL
ncbi:hypothetical protein TNCV_840721 [Trichonephila clavipes]|nr:hypothetical protein TNCV_840721 [Trichonephila clavipes]